MDALVTLAAAALTPVSVAGDLVRTGRAELDRLAATTTDLLEETAVTVRAARTVLLHVADALEAGLLDDLVAGLEDLSRAVAVAERVSEQVDHALPVLDSAAPTLTLMNSTLAQLEATLAQLQAMPGVRIARRLVTRPGQRTAPLELEDQDPDRLF